jgi:hypothetical protein
MDAKHYLLMYAWLGVEEFSGSNFREFIAIIPMLLNIPPNT